MIAPTTTKHEAIRILIRAINVILIAHGYEVVTEQRGEWTTIAYRMREKQ